MRKHVYKFLSQYQVQYNVIEDYSKFHWALSSKASMAQFTQGLTLPNKRPD